MICYIKLIHQFIELCRKMYSCVEVRRPINSQPETDENRTSQKSTHLLKQEQKLLGYIQCVSRKFFHELKSLSDKILYRGIHNVPANIFHS